MSEQYKIQQIDERIKNLQSEIEGCKIIRKHLVDDLKKKEDDERNNKSNSLLFKYLENFNIISYKDYSSLSTSDKFFWRYNYNDFYNDFYNNHCKNHKDIDFTPKIFRNFIKNNKYNDIDFSLVQNKGNKCIILQKKDIVIKTIKCKNCLNTVFERDYNKHITSQKCLKDTIELLKTKKLLGITKK